MKKKGFTLMEVAVAFTIFLVAFIPILELTRGTTLTLFRKNRTTGGSSGGDIVVQEDYAGNIVDDFLRQVERTGYTYVKGISEKRYTLKAEDGSTSATTGCSENQYYLAGNDALTNDPYTGKKKCFVQSDENEKMFNDDKLVLTATEGKMLNLTTLQTADITELQTPGTKKAPPFIYVEAKLLDTHDSDKELEKNDTIVTPFQDLCVI